MLLFSLMLSLGLISVAYSTCKREWFPVIVPLLLTGAGVLTGCLLSPPLVFQALLVIPVVLICKGCQWSPRTLLTWLVVTALVPYGFFLVPTIGYMVELHRLKEQYAFESMETRLPERKKPGPTKLSKETEENLDSLQKDVSSEINSTREWQLRRLHQSSVQSFIASPGFGVGRGVPSPSERTLKVNLDPEPAPLSQPEPVPTSTLAEDDLRKPSDVKLDPLRDMHLNSVVDFSYPSGFDLIVSRKEVAGFEPHRFTRAPKVEQWKLQTVELVGLLKHDEPIVYISDELPNMKKLRAVPTRGLNTFEARGLPRLQEGDDLFVRQTDEGIHMLGAVRSIDQCMKCHGGERGDLLGAFSYSLRRLP